MLDLNEFLLVAAAAAADDVCSFSSVLRFFTVLNMLFLLIQILTYPMGLSLPFLFKGEFTICGQAEFPTIE